jgi:hypothetical protein
MQLTDFSHTHRLRGCTALRKAVAIFPIAARF